MNTNNISLLLGVLFCIINLMVAQPNNLNWYIGDFDGDSNDDILRQEKGSLDDDNKDTAKVYLSDGHGISVRQVDESFGLQGDYANLYIGDFNGDGRDDILRQEKGSWDEDKANNTVFVLLSTGPGTFQKSVLQDDFELQGADANLFVADFDGDGLEDILRQEKGEWASDSVNTAYLLYSNGDGTFDKVILDETYGLQRTFTNLYIGDFNGDGSADIVRQEKGEWATDDVNTAYLLLSNILFGRGFFEKIVLSEDLGLNGDYTNLYVGDFNGDKVDDLLRQEKGAWASDSVNTAHVLYSTALNFDKYVLDESFGLNGDYTNLYIGDFNGDGRDDILRQEKGEWATDNVNTAFLLLSNAYTMFDKIVMPENYDLQASKCKLYIGDFNNDGKSDIWKYWGNDQSGPYISQGDGTLKYMS